jgi:hypothetical protein
VFGAFYNDGSPGTGQTGDIIAAVQLGDDGSGLRGSFQVVRCLAPECNLPTEREVLVSDRTTFPAVALGTVHRLSLGWTGRQFVFGFDGSTATFDPTAAAPVAGPPRVPIKGIGVRVSGIDALGEGGRVTAQFDNFVGINVPPRLVTAASTGVDGAPANGPSGTPAVSGDGAIVAFDSAATNLVATGCTTGTRQVFTQDRASGVITCESVDLAGRPGDGPSLRPALNGDGRVLAFVSGAGNLASPCGGGATQILVRDRQTGQSTCESVGTGGVGNAASGAPVLSADGRFVAFQSAATNLAAPCTGGGLHVFLRDRQTGGTICVSAAGGVAGNGPSDGRA